MRRRQLLATVLVLLLTASVIGVFILVWINWRIIRISRQMAAKQRVFAVDGIADCILVPGGPIGGDGRPGPMLERRLAAAVQLYQAGQSDKILISGDGLSPGYDEIAPMYRYLLDEGIPADRIVIDPAGLDTFETLFRAQRCSNIQRAIIATQPFHLQRALYLADRLKLNLSGEACAMPKDRLSYGFLPREIVARVKAFLDVEVLRIQNRP